MSADPAGDLSNVTRHFNLIRSKDAGPFMLTIDLFFSDEHARRAFRDSGVLSAERIGELYRVDPAQVQVFDMDDIGAMKISFPRPVPSGEFGDTDITGGQQYGLLVDLIAELDIEGEGGGLVVRDRARL
ncbi:MAG TPA: DUF4387 family protein [Acidimicrobiales bacterium]|nr:DUF4387 family protein [Acidimicrobiales bacterium]